MPIYTYRCDNCGVQFDQKQLFTDPLLQDCPDCGKKALHKVYTPVGIVFKGSGFYATDHRSPSGQNKNKSSQEEKTSISSETSSTANEASSTSSSSTDKKSETSTSASKSETSK